MKGRKKAMTLEQKLKIYKYDIYINLHSKYNLLLI